MKKLFGAIVMMAVALFFTACGGEKTPSDVAEEAAQCMINKDYKGYVDMLAVDAEEGKDVEKEKEALVQLIEEKAGKSIEEKGGIKSYEILSETIAEDGQTANVELKFVYGDGSEENSDVKLKKNADGEWVLTLGK